MSSSLRSPLPPLLLLLSLLGCSAAPPPTLSLIPAQPSTSQDLYLFVQEQDQSQLIPSWYRDGELQDLQGWRVPAALTRRDQLWSVKVEGPQGVRAHAELRILDSLPVVGATLSPSEPLTGDPFSIQQTVSDLDGDEVSVGWSWFVNSVIVQQGPSRHWQGTTVHGDQVWAEGTPSDGTLEGRRFRTMKVEVGNTPPQLDSVSLSADSARRSDTLRCLPGATTDPDGERVGFRFQWFVNELPVGPDRDTLDGDLFFSGDSVRCQATPNDGTDDGPSQLSPSIPVVDSPPSVPLITITPRYPVVGRDRPQCLITQPSQDADGDAVSYSLSWTLDGAPYSASHTTDLPGDTLDDAVLARQQVWRCTLRASAGGVTVQSAEALAETGHDRNVLVVFADDIGTDKLGLMGEHPDTPPTPTLDRLAAEGVMFRNAYANPVCSPSRAALLTGRYGRRTGIGRVIQMGSTTYGLPLSERTLAEVVSDSPLGYSSSAVGKWHLEPFNGSVGANHANLQGFQWFSGPPANVLTYLYYDGSPASYNHWEKITNGLFSWSTAYVTTEEIDDARDRIAAMPEPWLLYLPLTAAHEPWGVPPAELISQPVSMSDSRAVRYGAIIEAMDTELGRLLDGMDPGVRADTTIIFMGDNGTPKPVTTAPFKSSHAKATLYEGGTGVPLIIAGPWVTQPGSETDALAHVVDIFATVAEIAEVDPTAPISDGGLPPPEIDGVSLLPLLAEPAGPGLRQEVFTERFRPNGPPPYDADNSALRGARFKLMRVNGVESLFDLLGRDDDGPDLLLSPLSDEAATAYASLSARLDALTSLPYEGP